MGLATEREIQMFIDNSGIQHENYSAACEYYGADTPEDLMAEGEAFFREDCEAHMDAMSAAGGPVGFHFQSSLDDMPF